MSGYDSISTAPASSRLLRDNLIILSVYSAALFLSALLLFSVQPMFAKLALPKLGGSPAVWAVAMCFFQAVLLLGYCYAHLLGKWFSARMSIVIHLAVCALAFIALPPALPQDWGAPPQTFTQIWLLGLFGMAIGLPFFAVSANAPLLQSWFSKTGHPHRGDPYFLYGASNIGSLIALLGYPILIEPFIGLTNQTVVWSIGFAVLIASIGVSGALMLVNSAAGASSPNRVANVATSLAAEPVTLRRRLQWTALAFVPSGLLVAFTTHITTDVASAPFLWVGPLALYLLTYILVFRDPPVLKPSFLLKLQPVFVGTALLLLLGSGYWVWVVGGIAGTCAFFTTAMICHRELYERRPAASHLTEFYLWMSLGGVLGGIFTALIAPVIFSLVLEYPLLLALGLLCRSDVLNSSSLREHVRTPVTMALLATGVFVLAMVSGTYFSAGGPDIVRAFLSAVIATFGLAALRRGQPLICAAIAVLCVLIFITGKQSERHTERSFFGVHRVWTTADGKHRLLAHGTTIHGAERLIDDNGLPVEDPVPATYYHPGGPMAGLLDTARAGGGGQPITVGVVGLGAAALACHARASEDWRFFEIDPVVVSIASNPEFFRFMSHCRPGQQVVVGDARLTVAGQEAAIFDYLVIDAFSSDSIPVHLLTVEALKSFMSKISENGVLVLHITNKFLDLEPVVEAAVAQLGGHGVSIVDVPDNPGFDAAKSRVVAISRKPLDPAQFKKWSEVRPFGEPRVAAWTDDYSNIVSALLRKALKD